MKKSQLKNSKFGVISFGIFLFVIISIVIVTYQDVMSLLSTEEYTDVFTWKDFYITWGLIITNFIGTIFGIIGIAEKNKKKIYSILGFTLNGAMTLSSLVQIFF